MTKTAPTSASALTRRVFLAGTAATGLLHAYPRAALAQASELTMATWGGDEIKDLTAAFAKPFTNESGIKVLFDGAGPSEGKIKAMVDQSQVEWGLCDVDGYVADTFSSLDAMRLRAEDLQGSIENLVGAVEVPVGLAGPLLVHGRQAQGLCYLPMATTEGTLVASATRGAAAPRLAT